jgi:hypothetical protein
MPDKNVSSMKLQADGARGPADSIRKVGFLPWAAIYTPLRDAADKVFWKYFVEADQIKK